MSQTIDEIRAFVAHPEVDSMEPIWPLTQSKARDILEHINGLVLEISSLRALAGRVDSHQTITFGDIKQAARRNGADAL